MWVNLGRCLGLDDSELKDDARRELDGLLEPVLSQIYPQSCHLRVRRRCFMNTLESPFEPYTEILCPFSSIRSGKSRSSEIIKERKQTQKKYRISKHSSNSLRSHPTS